MNRKVLLIQPATHGRTTVRPLGLGYLSSYLLTNGYKVKIIDNDIHQYASQELRQLADAFVPEVIGITTNILNKWNAIEIAEAFSKQYPYIVFGGPQATIAPEEFLSKENYYVIRGEGEISFLNFLRAIEAKADLTDVKSLSFKSNGNVSHNPLETPIKDLDTSPFPNINLFEFEKYKFSFQGKKSTNLITSRGCPFKCIYCYHRMNASFRQRSPENVIEEIKHLNKDYGFKAFKFFDDNFTLRKKFVVDFCEKLIKSKLKARWQCLSAAKNVGEELLKIMYKSGCRQISFGIESGCQKSLDLMGKRTTVNQNKEALRLCRKIGITSKAYIIIGFPWETKEDIRETACFLEENPSDYLQLFFATPFPNTDLEKMVLEKNYVIDTEILRGARDFNVPMFETENFTKEELIKMHKDITKTHKKKSPQLYLNKFSLFSSLKKILYAFRQKLSLQ